MPRSRNLSIALTLLTLAGCTTGPSASSTQGAQATQPSSVPATPRATPTPLWPAPVNAMDRTVEAGLVPETKEYLEFHVHAHLDIFVDGQPILVPAGIGINITDPSVKTFEEGDGSVSYGGIEAACSTPCISPLHTHGAFGIIHTESATPTPNTLGQFFVEWGVELSASCVGEHCSPQEQLAFYVNGQPYTGDPNEIALADMTQIAIVIGTPPAEIPSTADFTLL